MRNFNNNEPRFYTLFAMLVLVSGICSSILGPRVITLGNYIPDGELLSGGIFPFCISFILLDITTNQYGYEKARKLVVYYLICKSVMCIFLYMTMKFKPAADFHDELSYSLVIILILKSFWASTLGTLASFFLNCKIFSKLYISFKGRHLWLRCLVATTLGEVVFSLISTPILFYGRLPMGEIFTLIFHNYIFKIIFEIVTLPLIYLSIHALNKYEPAYNISYNFNPPHKEINPNL